ncbi:hypothetical protein [Polaribacter porphyrae]|uniref:Lipoprotein n=1 Tax=Polaribacter porphyrae TaxID=1137780 RepID=A0A2S7WMU6_9FLAO|nr:hypothetical protein [Polaribacter porphyrae]PQJ78909.1 hypothetical protein BTO18_06810 [Polaribacter porphyrae]
MKTNKFLVLLIAVSFVFTACSNEENTIAENPNKNLLKTFKVKRDATGAYSVDLNVNDNTKVDKVINTSNNLSEFYLYSSENQTQSNVSENLLIDNNELKVSFIQADNNKVSNVTILDDDISFLSKSSDNEKLASYEISSTEDGNYELNFDVNNNVDVSFVFNDDTNTYEIHLESGKGGETNFSRVLEKEDSLLKLDFVNHVDNANAKSSESEMMLIRKPKVIIDDGDAF